MMQASGVSTHSKGRRDGGMRLALCPGGEKTLTPHRGRPHTGAYGAHHRPATRQDSEIDMNTRRTLPLLLVAATFVLAARGASSADAPDGKALFISNKCNTCHTIKTLGIEKKKAEDADEKEKSDKKPPDLSSVGLERKAEWIGKFLMKTETIKGDKHPRRFRGTEAELKTVASWLEAQKAPKKK
jgi:mono/diheme cytochrome c family protein